MNDTVGGPHAEIVLLATGKSTRARMVRIGTVRRDLFVMREVSTGHTFIAEREKGMLIEWTPNQAFDEIEGLSRALAHIDATKAANYSQPNWEPLIAGDSRVKPADEDYVRPLFLDAEPRVFL